MAQDWTTLMEELSSPSFISSLRESKYSRLWACHGEDSGMELNEFQEFCYWARRKLGANKKAGEVTVAPQPVELKKDTIDYGHGTGYYFDDVKDLYIVHIQSKKLLFSD